MAIGCNLRSPESIFQAFRLASLSKSNLVKKVSKNDHKTIHSPLSLKTDHNYKKKLVNDIYVSLGRIDGNAFDFRFAGVGDQVDQYIGVPFSPLLPAH